ncbi:MAG: biopolymer transporter ExbD [Verrucomicrobiota bacterium]
MKVELTLDEKPGPLHVMAAVDIIVLVMVLGFVVTGLAHRAGIEVNLASSAFRVAADTESVVLTVKGATEPVFYVDALRVEEEGLVEVLRRKRDEEGASQVLLQADVRLPAAFQRRLSELILAEGLDCVWVAEPEGLR